MLSATDEERIIEKAVYVQEAVAVLSRKQSIPFESYRDSREQRAIVEREFQTAIEACLDIAGIILTAIGEPMPKTNAGRFKKLGQQNIISTETESRMRKAAGFRNILAHNYGNDIDDSAVYQYLQDQLHWFVQFLSEIRRYLQR